MQEVYLKKHPLENLKGTSFPKNKETKFGNAFSDHYFCNFTKIHSRTHFNNYYFLKEVPIYGLGISDLLSIGWKGKDDILEDILNGKNAHSKLKVRAFEFKLKDWRGGLFQAYRYSYYADTSILVVPLNTFENAFPALVTFKKLNIGLWGYDEEKNILKIAYTPRSSKNLGKKYKDKFVLTLKEYFNQSQPIS